MARTIEQIYKSHENDRTPDGFIDELVRNGIITTDEQKNQYKRLWTYLKGKSAISAPGGSDKSDTFASLLKSQMSETRSYYGGLSQDLISVDKTFQSIMDYKEQMRSAGDNQQLKDEINKRFVENTLATEFNSELEKRNYLLEEINGKIGMTGTLSENFRNEIRNAGPDLIRFGVSFQDLTDSAKSLVENSGRFVVMSRDSLIDTGKVAKAFVGSMSQLTAMFPEFEKIGVGAISATKSIEKAGKSSLELGLSSQKITKDLSTNLGKLNEYGFKNGIEGLTRMAQKATQFRMSMEEVFKIADKVMSPEGAIDLAANLQVLGGAIGDFNDPLKLMYMATNNVEGLQDSLIGAASSLASYNSEQGRFEITGVNLRRAKEMATQLGVSYQELAKGAIAAAERTSAASTLMARGLTFKDEKDRDFLTNLAQMKDGKMVIDIPEGELRKTFGASQIALEQITEEQKQDLLKYREEFVKLTPEQIIEKQASDIANLQRDASAILDTLKAEAGNIGNEVLKKDLGDPLRQMATEMREFSISVQQAIRTTSKGTITPLLKEVFQKEVSNVNNITTTTPATVKGTTPVQPVTEEKVKKEAPPSPPTPEPKNSKVEVVHTFKSDTIMDPIKRHLMYHPADWMEPYNPLSFTNTQTVSA